MDKAAVAWIGITVLAGKWEGRCAADPQKMICFINFCNKIKALYANEGFILLPYGRKGECIERLKVPS
jgi:hypothetical protein